MESRKIVLMNLFAGQQWRDRHKNRLVDTVGEGEGGMNSESSFEIYTLPCVKQIAGEKLLYNNIGSPALCSVVT